ncbi:MAG: hypothetical protein H0U76_20350 [Ktedonobacteraceae bacterium]|nr:hypothetical protein [Ktedonobacteraceae bacterium]
MSLLSPKMLLMWLSPPRALAARRPGGAQLRKDEGERAPAACRQRVSPRGGDRERADTTEPMAKPQY